jgi:hypothetical protein
VYISIQVNIKVVINLTIPETVVTLGTQDTGRRKTTQKQKHNIECPIRDSSCLPLARTWVFRGVL